MSAGLATCPHCDWERWAPTPAYAQRIRLEHNNRDHPAPKTTKETKP